MEPRIITELKDAIRAQYGCAALYVNTVHVDKKLKDDPHWDGLVTVFELIGHPKAKRCYAWSYGAGKAAQRAVLLETGVINSADVAVSFANGSTSAA